MATDARHLGPAVTADEQRVIDRRAAIIGGAFLAVAGVAAARVPSHNIDLLGKGKIDQLIPHRIGQWNFFSKSGLVVPPADQLSDSLYSQLLTRVYVAPDALPIMFLIAQSGGQTGILQVHRPEFCYPAGGFTLTDKIEHPVGLQGSSLNTVVMTATADDRIEQLLYWTRVGLEMPMTWRQQRMSVAMANLRGDIPDAVMVRISTVTPDRALALKTMDEFARSLFAAVPPNVRRVLDINAR